MITYFFSSSKYTMIFNGAVFEFDDYSKFKDYNDGFLRYAPLTTRH